MSDQSQSGQDTHQTAQNQSDKNNSQDAQSQSGQNAGQAAQNQESTNQPQQEQGNSSQSESANADTQNSARYYTVKKGDSLMSISKTVYHTTQKVQDICNANQIENMDMIYEGQQLLLP